MEKHDIVYILRNDIEPQELRYSLRSLENFPHRDVRFVGGEPAYLRADRQVYIAQKGATPWERSTYTIQKICSSDETPEEFWLFNDDFFIMKPQKELGPKYNGDLWAHIAYIERRHGGRKSAYTAQLRRTAEKLEDAGFQTRNYAMHIPMLINKQNALETLDRFPFTPMFRSLYGNMHDIGGENMADVKIATITEKPSEEAEFLSTSDNSWLVGEIGRFIRARFTEPSKYETDK